MTRYIGIDLGKYETTAAEIVNGVANISRVPSVVAPQYTTYEKIRQQSLVEGLENSSKHISVNGLHWISGPMAWKNQNAVIRLDPERFTSDPMRAIIFLALDGMGITSEDFAIYFAVPYNLTTDPVEYETLLKKLQDIYLGQHHVAIDGVHKIVKISQIGMEAQPKLAIFGAMFDDQMKWKMDGRASTDDFIIYDHGFGDLAVVTIRNLKIDDDATEEREVGMSNAAKILIKLLQLEYKNRLNLFDADALIRQAVIAKNLNGSAPQPTVINAQINGATKDVADQAMRALNQYLSTPLGFAHEKTGLQNNACKIMVGGGAHALHGPLQEAIEGEIMMDGEPSTTVARGAAKVAKKKFSRG